MAAAINQEKGDETAPAVKESREKLKKILGAQEAKSNERVSGKGKQGAKVSKKKICEECEAEKRVKKMKKAIRPKDKRSMISVLTALIEGSEGYCSLSDKPSSADKGGLSYGIHQASETSGSLHAMLKQYDVKGSTFLSEDDRKTFKDQLGKFNSAGTSYGGTSDDRSKFKSILRKACKDPKMAETQDAYFDAAYYTPALAKAADRGVTSPLGQAMFYDTNIQGGCDVVADRAMEAYIKKYKLPSTTTKIRPEDEREYLTIFNEKRRARLAAGNSTGMRASVNRADEFEALLDDDNMNLDRDFIFRDTPVHGLSP